MDIKLAVIYYSATGTNYEMAKHAYQAAVDAGATVKILKAKETAPAEAIAKNEAWQNHIEATKEVSEVKLDDLEWADAILFSMPTRFGNLPSQVECFFDTTGGLWSEGKLANKVVSGMTSAQNIHGGQETTLMSLYKTMIHWGAILAPPGYTDPAIFKSGGNPYGLSVVAGPENVTDAVIASIRHQTNRIITVANWVKTGLINL